MIDWLVWLVLGFMLFFSYLDIKYKAIPSVFLTSLALIVLIARPENLIFGAILGLFGLAISEFLDNSAGMEFGLADIKILVIFGLLFVNSYSLIFFLIIFAILQFGYTVVWRSFVGKDKNIPFIPCLLAILITMMITGVVA